MARATPRRTVTCYFCRHRLEVSGRALSTACPKCNRAIKIEDVTVKSYLPVNDLQTCGQIKVTKRGRVVARRIQAGDGITCEGTLEGAVETQGPVRLGSKSTWKGQSLHSASLRIDDGAKLLGLIQVPAPQSPAEDAPAAPANTHTAAP